MNQNYRYFLILPNQLFNIRHIDKSYHIILWECPHFFKAYKYNKKKLILHRASMRYYYDYLQRNKCIVSYIPFTEHLDETITYSLYNPLNKPEVLGLPKYYQIIHTTPNLLLSPELLSEYRKKTKNFFFNAFYMWSKKELNIIPNVQSQDKLNRETPSTHKIVKQPSATNSRYVQEAITYVEKHFPDNYGNTDNFIFPVSHTDARKWLKHFITYKFKHFGKYQDYMHTNDKYLYHSLLSSLLNIGLLNPMDIIAEISKYKSSIPINSHEGFIRQLFWREYQYYCYVYFDFGKQNYFSNQKKLTKQWYDGTTGILPLDDAIKDAFNSGYLHHIRRLMVIGNYMNLSRINPKEGFRWFMEFSCDSYEWVMHQNVYDMVFFVSGGKTMRRPYISSSNYILKMSNYKKGDWSALWDSLYRNFIASNKHKLWKYRYYIRL